MKTPSFLLPLLLFCLAGCAQGKRNSTPVYPFKQRVPLSNFFGVNAYEWNFEDPGNSGIPDSTRVSAIKNFTGVRHYLDWEKLEYTEGSYTFNPTFNGGWNYDTIYQWCRSQHIEVLACIKTIPKWMESTYPESKRDNENVPARYGKNLSAPASYIEQAKLAFQFAARYGSNKTVDTHLLKVNTTPRWTGDNVNTIRTGLGLVRYIECDNERDKWWKGRQAQQTGAEYAANLSAFYDGNKGAMGAGVGVKNADTAMKVVMGGLANADPKYLKEMIEWSREHRGYRADGYIDLPWDIINYHYYCNDANGTDKDAATGAAPELTLTAQVASAFVEMAHLLAKDMPVWVTETGFDINPKSTQRAGDGKPETILQTQADWTLRTALLLSRTGIQKVFFYQLYDDNAASTMKYGTSGLLNADRTPRPAACYMHQINKLFGAYCFAETLNTVPIVDRYTCNNKSMFVLTQPVSQSGKTTYKLNLGKADTAYIYIPQPTGNNMFVTKKKTIGGKVDIEVGETPVFVSGEAH